MLKGKKKKRMHPMFFQYMDNRSVRTDEWSLTEIYGAGWELYRLTTDHMETNNLVKVYRAVVKTLQKCGCIGGLQAPVKRAIQQNLPTTAHITSPRETEVQENCTILPP